MSHYDVLEVPRDAPVEEIRRAYLALARQYHPDFHSTSDEPAVLYAEERMRRVNLAWQVLGDETSRAAYDRSLGLRDDRGPVSSGPIIKQPSTAFRPYDAGEDDDSWRHEPDEGDPSTVPPRLQLVAPPALLALGLLLLALSLPTDSRQLMTLGIICLAASVLCFIAVPLLAMFRSQGAEERAARQR